MEILGTYLQIFLMVCTRTIGSQAVTVSPSLCPTNKIAPHRRIGSRDPGEPRTLGLFYDLLAPQRPPHIDPYNDLQEQPQEDDPNDCGEIDDYDETDLSSVTQQAQRKRDRHNRMLFGSFYRTSYPANTPVPPRPQRPQRPPTRPPFWSGGVFGSNVYRPPSTQRPSNYIKPVHEDTADTHATYRPDVVGGPIGHVVGFTPARPADRYPRPGTTTQKTFRFPGDYESHTRAPRTRPVTRSTSIVGSFVDLFFK